MSLPAFAIERTEFAKEDIVVDSNGNTIRSVITETANEIIVDVYVNERIDNSASTNKATQEITLKTYTNGSITDVEKFNSSDFIQAAPTGGIVPYGEIIPSVGFDIYGRVRTDYRYNGSILYGDTYSRFSEVSGTRYDAVVLNFSRGDAASLAVSALFAAFGGAIGTATVVALLAPVVAGKLQDGFTKTVSYTTGKVETRVYFDSIYTVNVSRTYNKVLVSVSAASGDAKYSDDYYGYDIVKSLAGSACQSGSLAFYHKYIVASKPNLSLPITQLPYT